ncbi:hypothetical protein LZ30DRAFT_145604 [Colletotrichum cereale]|nr:hypothetical protein LZ30DRAFT_145604 [Colletotrichum cereale]
MAHREGQFPRQSLPCSEEAVTACLPACQPPFTTGVVGGQARSAMVPGPQAVTTVSPPSSLQACRAVIPCVRGVQADVVFPGLGPKLRHGIAKRASFLDMTDEAKARGQAGARPATWSRAPPPPPPPPPRENHPVSAITESGGRGGDPGPPALRTIMSFRGDGSMVVCRLMRDCR